ncbi:hypothetical protein ACHWQZ_G012027 [Mnemiopsis leidyi]
MPKAVCNCTVYYNSKCQGSGYAMIGKWKNLVDTLQTDLRSVSSEAKRRHPAVKDAAERAILKLRSLSAANDKHINEVIARSDDVIQPFILGCETKNPKLILISITCIQKLISHDAVPDTSVTIIVKTLSDMHRQEIELLRILQTILLLLTSTKLLHGETLAQAIAICFQLHSSSEHTIANTAAATLRQVVAVVFDRVIQEGIRQNEIATAESEKMGVCATDAYLLFQDICQLTNWEPPYWLVGVKEVPRTFGLELLENVLVSSHATFTDQKEFTFLLKERVCPLIIKLFSPSIKHSRGGPKPSATSDSNLFSVCVRLLRIVHCLLKNYHSELVTECEIFLSIIVKFLDADKPFWQRTVALEVLHQVCSEPALLSNFCKSYDLQDQSSKVFHEIMGAMGGFLQSLFTGNTPASQNGVASPIHLGQQPPDSIIFSLGHTTIMLSALPSMRSTFKPLLLSALEKSEAPPFTDGYTLGVTYAAILHIINSIFQSHNLAESNSDDELMSTVSEMTNASWHGLLAALSLLLDAAQDETARELVLKSHQDFASLCGSLGIDVARDAFITALCKASLPPHYDLFITGVKHVEDDKHLVMLSAKNIQCMRSLLSMAHCHGKILGTGWNMVLRTLQHLTWILGLVPTDNGQLVPSPSADGANVVKTAALSADLPIICSMLSRLFQSSQYLSEKALMHLIQALCQLSAETEASTSREKSLFSVGKILETCLVNLSRLHLLWELVSAHLLTVCHEKYTPRRTWGALALTKLLRAAIEADHSLPLSQNPKLTTSLLGPLVQMCEIRSEDVRLKQLECLHEILNSRGHTLPLAAWPPVLYILGSVVTAEHPSSETVVRQGFLSQHLLVNDFLPLISPASIAQCVEVTGGFGLQRAELNISLTAVGLLWHISDFLYQNHDKISERNTENEECGEIRKQEIVSGPIVALRQSFLSDISFDTLWISLFQRVGDLCIDVRPPVRKSAGQTLFSTLSAHGDLLKPQTWNIVLWKVLFPLLEEVKCLSSTAPDESLERAETNTPILVHHSRNTACKQWAETQVGTISGVARVFQTWRKILFTLDNFFGAWELLLRHIESGALHPTSEVSTAALASFHELLKDNGTHEGTPELWDVAWHTWHTIGHRITHTYLSYPVEGGEELPSQNFLTSLMRIFTLIYPRVASRFTREDMMNFSKVVRGVAAVPIGPDLPFVLSAQDCNLTPLQSSILVALECVDQCPDTEMSLAAHVIMEYLVLGTLSYLPPPVLGTPALDLLGKKLAHQTRMSKSEESVYIALGEQCISSAVEIYRSRKTEDSIIRTHIMENIVKMLRGPLGLKYSCPSQSTWLLCHSTLLSVIEEGVDTACDRASEFEGMWIELGKCLEEFLFGDHRPPVNLTYEERMAHEQLDVRMIRLIQEQILPRASHTPPTFISHVMTLLNRGSVHATSPQPLTTAELYNPLPATLRATDPDAINTLPLREQFAKSCFETLLQFSFYKASSSSGDVSKLALGTLLKRCQEVLQNYVKDEKLSGRCPLPRSRMAEIAFVMRAISSLIGSLQARRDHMTHIDVEVWDHVVGLYPYLIDCVTCNSNEVRDTLKEALHRFRDLLVPPKLATLETDGSDKPETEIARPEEVVPDFDNYTDSGIMNQEEGRSKLPEAGKNKKKFAITETDVKTLDSEVAENKQNSVSNPEG